MNTTDLGGHSGCTILLCEEDDDTVFVRKIAGDAGYNNRLKQQAMKQKNYQNDYIKKPKVLDMGETEEGLFYFDMEYIQGITLAEYMKTIEINRIRGLVEAITSGMPIQSLVDSMNKESVQIFSEKIDGLYQKLHGKKNEIVDEAIEVLQSHDWSVYDRSFCHGDLTLENIIVKDNSLYLIDFLDSFYDSWILDLSTLLQDSQIMWSYRKEESVDMNTTIRLVVFRDILIETVKQKMGKDYVEVFYALLLKLIRIYPYTKDQLTYDFLNKKTKSVITIIRGAEK